MTTQFSAETKAENSGYNIYAMLYLMRIAKETAAKDEAKKQEALQYAEKITEFADKKHEAYTEAKDYIKQNKKKKFLFW